MLMLGVIQLLFYMTFMTIRLTIELLVLAARLLAFIFREVLVPGARATSEGLVALAGSIASRRAESQRSWSDHDDRELQHWRDGRRY